MLLIYCTKIKITAVAVKKLNPDLPLNPQECEFVDSTTNCYCQSGAAECEE